MLLERIDIDSCGSLDRIQLGPFSPRLNAVYGPAGSGKTATIEFIRSVMLGTDRHWHAGAVGAVVWAAADGLLHCRRDIDGTRAGRLSIDFIARDGMLRSYHYGHRDANNYERLERMVELPRAMIDALVAPGRDTSLRSMLAACRSVGIDATETAGDDAEMARIRLRISDLDVQLRDEGGPLESHAALELRRRELIDQLAHWDRLEQIPPDRHSRRASLELRLADARDEVTRLRLQETDLRHALADVDRELSARIAHRPAHNGVLKIAEVRRIQLEELDNQLVRLCRTLREIRGLVEQSSDTYGWIEHSEPESVEHYYAATRPPQPQRLVRLESARRHLEWLLRNYARSPLAGVYTDRARTYDALESDYLGRAEWDAIIASVRRLTEHLETCERTSDHSPLHSDDWRDCESALIHAIVRLVERRGELLQQIAAEHHIPIASLTDAFGDWAQCHDAPHLYAWLLSDRFPPRATDDHVARTRRGRLEAEQRELIDELNRTANRLDDSISDVRILEGHLRKLPVALPVAIDEQQRQRLRAQLADIERQIRWRDARQSLEDERRQLQRRLESLVRGSRRESSLLARGSFWLDRLSAGRWKQLSAALDSLDHRDDGSPRTLSDAQRQTVALALRMAAADALRRRGAPIPLVIDEPPATLCGDRVMTDVLAQFAATGQQLIVFTGNRPLADNFRAAGGQVHAMTPPQLYELRYSDHYRAAAPRNHSGYINRELDTAWREANGLYDDPHWFRTGRQPRVAEPLHRDWSGASHTVGTMTDEKNLDGRARRGPASPFFLTESSPTEQAPSIDAVAAGRLQTLGVVTVGQLLAADPRSLAERLDLTDVTTEVVRRWQLESHLVCSVPQLRNFDARVLVGCGLTHPRQLANMNPGQLLERVEAFLATERGRQILRSGTSYELSRITSWIAAANRSVARTSRRPEATRLRIDPETQLDSRPERAASQRGNHRTRPERERAAHDGESRSAGENRRHQKFTLQLRSPLVDAPSIGPKTAARLHACGYPSVQAFLAADPAAIAKQLGNRRITEAKVRRWQDQATLVCRVPRLRSHDAQLLVEAGVTQAERLAESEADPLYTKIDRIARSQEGRRILRGAKRPDRAEIADWIRWAKENRSLRVA